MKQNVKKWNTSKVTTMKCLFSGKNDFNENISEWDTSSVTNMHGMFTNTSFNQDISRKSVTIGDQNYTAWFRSPLR